MRVLMLDWKPSLTKAVVALGAMWTATEVLDFFLELDRAQRAWMLPVYLIVAAAVGLVLGRRPRSVEFIIPGTDTSVEIAVGDLFARPGCRAISVNEFFDTALPDHVSPNSLHGRFLTTYYDHQSANARSAIDAGLEGHSYVEVDRRSGATRRYQIGTTAEVVVGSHQYLLVALAHTDLETLTAYATARDLQDALDGLWNAARQKCSGADLAVPLIGSGLSRVGLPTRQLLDVVVGSAHCRDQGTQNHKQDLHRPDRGSFWPGRSPRHRACVVRLSRSLARSQVGQGCTSVSGRIPAA